MKRKREKTTFARQEAWGWGGGKARINVHVKFTYLTLCCRRPLGSFTHSSRSGVGNFCNIDMLWKEQGTTWRRLENHHLVVATAAYGCAFFDGHPRDIHGIHFLDAMILKNTEIVPSLLRITADDADGHDEMIWNVQQTYKILQGNSGKNTKFNFQPAGVFNHVQPCSSYKTCPILSHFFNSVQPIRAAIFLFWTFTTIWSTQKQAGLPSHSCPKADKMTRRIRAWRGMPNS